MNIMIRTDYGNNFKIFCIQMKFLKRIVTGFRMEIRGYFCMVIENIKDEIHVGYANGNLTKIIL